MTDGHLIAAYAVFIGAPLALALSIQLRMRRVVRRLRAAQRASNPE